MAPVEGGGESAHRPLVPRETQRDPPPGGRSRFLYPLRPPPQLELKPRPPHRTHTGNSDGCFFLEKRKAGRSDQRGSEGTGAQEVTGRGGGGSGEVVRPPVPQTGSRRRRQQETPTAKPLLSGPDPARATQRAETFGHPRCAPASAQDAASRQDLHTPPCGAARVPPAVPGRRGG